MTLPSILPWVIPSDSFLSSSISPFRFPSLALFPSPLFLDLPLLLFFLHPSSSFSFPLVSPPPLPRFNPFAFPLAFFLSSSISPFRFPFYSFIPSSIPPFRFFLFIPSPLPRFPPFAFTLVSPPLPRFNPFAFPLFFLFPLLSCSLPLFPSPLFFFLFPSFSFFSSFILLFSFCGAGGVSSPFLYSLRRDSKCAKHRGVTSCTSRIDVVCSGLLLHPLKKRKVLRLFTSAGSVPR